MINPRIFTLLLLIGMFCATNATAEQFRFKYYNTSDGLPSNSIRCITQDHHGFIWIGTDNGLSRFSGQEFKSYKNIPGDSTSIGSNYINFIFEDSRNIFWVGTGNGLYTYNSNTESFSFFSKTTENNLQLTASSLDIIEDLQGNIWVATEGDGVFCFNPQKEILKQFTSNAENISLSSNTALNLFVDSKGNIWASTRDAKKSLHLFDSATNNFHLFPIKNVSSSLTIYAINEDTEGNLWLGTWEDGLCKLNIQEGTIKSYISPQTKDGISHIHSISKYEPDILLVGSDDGLSQFNTITKEHTLMTSSELQEDGLSDKFIYPIYKDREGGLWVGGYYKGLNYSAPNKGYIEGFTHSKYKNSVGGNIISCFCEDESGNVWIGSDDGGLSYFDTKTKHFTNYMPGQGKNGLSYHNVHALLIDDGKLWIGTYTGGLNVMDLKTGYFKLYLPDLNNPRSIDGNSIYSLFKDHEGVIWIGSMQGLNTYNKKTDDFTRVLTTESTTIDIVQEKDGTMWFATWGGGVYRYTPSTEEWKHFRTKKSNEKTIQSDMVHCLCIDNDGRVWLGTDNGLCYYDKTNDCFVRESLTIPSNSISNIIYNDNFLWISTATGFVRYSPETKKTKIFTTSDGLQNDQFTLNGGMLSSDNKIYLGTTNGFNIMRPQTFSSNKYAPPIVITNFQVFNKNVDKEDEEALKKAINSSEEFKLSYKQSVFSIEYAALSYSDPSKNRYMYKLEGFDQDWNPISNQRKATYTNLPAGKYIFRVRGSNNDGLWNEDEATLTIRILPPFWRSRWAYLFYAIAFAASIFYIIHFFKKKAERKNKIRIRKLNAEKEKELHEAKINFFTQVAHEIRTPVSLIIGPLEKIIEQSSDLKPTIQEDLHIINRNSQRLLTLVNQLLEFRKAEQGSLIPHFSTQNIYGLLKGIYDRFNPLITKKGISFEFDMQNKELMATVDSEAFIKIISNLLTNAAKHAKNKIRIEVATGIDDFNIRVIDDGEGIPESEHQNIFKPFYQISNNNKPGTGIGLSLVKLLVEAHAGKIEVASEQGNTCFSVSFPLIQASTQNGQEKSNTLAETNDYSLLLDDEMDIPYVAEANRPTLLIVEDNIDLCNFLYNRFRHSYNILIAHNGKEGLDLLKKQSVDIIISDIAMPIMDGIEFCKEVKSNLLYSHIPIVLLTAKTENTVRMESLEIGADAYIEKPFSIQLLKVQLTNLLNSRKLLKKKFSEMPFVKLDSIAGNKADEAFLSKLNSIIEKNISNVDFSIDVLAEQLFISRSGLFSKIKTLADMTPNELIHLVRLKKAAELLITKEYRINEICYMVGFNNPSYFSKCFQKQFGVLPKDFINKQPINTTS